MTALPIKTEYAICIVVNIISLAVVAMTPWPTIDEILEIPSAGEHGQIRAGTPLQSLR